MLKTEKFREVTVAAFAKNWQLPYGSPYAANEHALEGGPLHLSGGAILISAGSRW